MLRLVEHYASVQGEGPRTGTLTQFVRFAGCNMRCPGWPCDTQHAIDPAIWRTNSYTQTPLQLDNAILDMYHTTGARNICLTGGEPFMQNHERLYEALSPSNLLGFTYEAFTNGSFPLPLWTRSLQMLFTMDWKLPGSGEQDTKLSNRLENAKFLKPRDAIKFVVKDKADLEEAAKTMLYLRTEAVDATFYLGRVWGASISDEDLVEYIKSHQLRDVKLNVQVHKLIWHPDKQGV